MNKKQTAVEWLVNEANKRKCWADEVKMNWLISEAKAMDRQQKIDDFSQGYHSGECKAMGIKEKSRRQFEDGDQYFTETYGENIKKSTNE